MKKLSVVVPEIDRSTYINLTTSHSEEEDTESSPFRKTRIARFSKSQASSSLNRLANFSISQDLTNYAPAERSDYKYKRVWKRALMKLKIRRAMGKLNDDILIYGTANDLLDINQNFKKNIDVILENKRLKIENFRRVFTKEENPLPWYIIHPESMFSKLWNVIVSFILIYTATLMPYRVAWAEFKLNDNWCILEFTIDGLFVLDIVINFFTTHITKQGNHTKSLKTIAYRYLRTWFLFDLTSCIPFSLIEMYLDDSGSDSESNVRYNSLIRLVRLPRLYKLLRVVRIVKVFRHYKESEVFEKIQDFLQLNSRIYKLIKFLLTVCLCVHIMGCFWFFSAKLQDFSPDTWVVRYGYKDSSNQEQYMASIYWAFTTVTTVGYGDIAAGNGFEQILCIFWMIVGVGFYSFTIGSLSAFLSAIDTRDSILSSKLAVVHEFAKETGISPECKQKIRESIKYSISKVGSVWSEKHSLFKDLPKALRYEVALSMYNGISKELHFFKNRNSSFIITVMPLLRPLKGEDKDYLYKEGDFPDEVFFISKGRVNLVLDMNEIAYKSFLKGTYIGEIEMIFKRTARFDNAQVCGSSEFLMISKKDFLDILDQFPDEAQQIISVAKERYNRNSKVKLEVETIIQLKANAGTLNNLEGRFNLCKDNIPEEDLNLENDIEEFRLDRIEKEIIRTKLTVTGLALQIETIEKGVKSILDKLEVFQIPQRRRPDTVLGRIISRSQSPTKLPKLPPLYLNRD